MGLKYAAIHISVHILTPVAIAYFFNLGLAGFLIAFIGSFIMDSDHFFLVLRHGVRGAFKKVVFQGLGKSRKYPLHNFIVVALAALGGFLVSQPEFFLVGIFSLAIFIHLLWDLLEDVIIFRLKPNNWKP